MAVTALRIFGDVKAVGSAPGRTHESGGEQSAGQFYQPGPETLRAPLAYLPF